MSKTITSQITDCIEATFNICGNDMSRHIIIFPCGDIGIQTVNILENIYSIKPEYIVDNNKCKYTNNIYDVSLFDKIDVTKYAIILASTNSDIYLTLREVVLSYFPKENLLELESMRENMVYNPVLFLKTHIGKYSYGPICRDHELIASIGSFCSFAPGVEVVPNHETNYITTHPMIYAGMVYDGFNISYDTFKDKPWYFPGVNPKEMSERRKRLTIGNDVWLGQNVIITNYANIGNGVIAGAGAIITKDVPDYAVVAGVPARIIKYRYSESQIIALNQIAWWDWSDIQIRERYNDLYLPIDRFIEKYTSVEGKKML